MVYKLWQPVKMQNSLTVTYLSKVKNIWMDRINKLNSKKIIQKDLGESIKWRRRYWEIYAKTLKVVTTMKIVTKCDDCHAFVTIGHVSHISVTFVTNSHTCVTLWFLHLDNFPTVMLMNESMNQWNFWLSPGFIKNESLINQRTHKIFHCLRHQSAKNFVHVMVNLGGWRNHIFVMVPGKLIEKVQ